MSRAAYLTASALLALALAALAFAGAGGLQLAQSTRTEIPVIIVGGLVLTVGALYARRGPLHGALPLSLFAGLTVLTALSIGWSVLPADSWIETNRTLSYFMAFAASLVAARLAPVGWTAVLNGILAALAAVCAYGLATRVWPATLASNDVFARISEPLGYWNALGVAAAMAFPGAMWLGARRSGNPAANALAYPLTGLLVITLFLTYSRGALLSALVGIGLWLLIVPLRLRALTVLIVSTAGAAPIVAWAYSRAAFTRDQVPLLVRESVAGEFGMILLLGALLLLLAGLVIHFRVSHRSPSFTLRRRFGLVVVVGVLALPLLAVSALATSPAGLTGTVSARVNELTAEDAVTAAGPERLSQVSSARGRYWRQAGRIFEERTTLGAGAGGYATARLRHRRDVVATRHAHGYIPQTMADLGLVGLLLSIALLLSWLFVAARNTSLHPWGRHRQWGPERVGLVSLLLTVVIYGLHSSVDWTWFVPGPTVMAMIAAGWVAGRGPLWPSGSELEDETAPEAAAGSEAAPRSAAGAEAPATAPVPSADPEPPKSPALAAAEAGLAGRTPESRVGSLLRSDGWRLGLALGILVTTAFAAWSAWQPQRSDAATQRALALVQARQLPQAAAEAQRAASIDPLSSGPLFARATVEQAAKRPREAERVLAEAVRQNPSDPEAWFRLGDFQLHDLNQPRAALTTLQGSLYLDPRSQTARTYFLEARAKARTMPEGGKPAAGGKPAPAPSQPTGT